MEAAVYTPTPEEKKTLDFIADLFFNEFIVPAMIADGMIKSTTNTTIKINKNGKLTYYPVHTASTSGR